MNVSFEFDGVRVYKELPQKHALYFMICGTISIGVWKIDFLTEN